MATPTIRAGQVLGHFRLVEKIGGGGQGVVFRAHDERFDKDVALKILPPMVLADEAARKRFHREAQAVGKLSHPNIATAFYFGEENGIDFLVTEYVSGSGLDEQVAQGPMPEATVLALGIQLASGLQAAHQEGIVHRDLKPGNLRITHDGHLKILDFGLAELLDATQDLASADTVTVNMTLTGTIPYMAPEQFGGVCDQRTDLWAAGAVLYEMTTGQLPFPETQVQQLKDAILHKDPVPPRAINPAISAGLERVILTCLQKDLSRRYQTAKQLHDDLERVAQGRRVKRDWQLHPTGLRAAAAVVLAGILGFATHHFWPRPPTAGTNPAFRVLAVLPIESVSADRAETALGRGVAESVSARIAQGTNGHAFQLIPPSELSAQGVKTAEQARREFNVDLVLAVGLQRSPERVRITCSLIDPRTHQQLDARTVTGEAADLFAAEDNAVTEVFGMLPKDIGSEQPAPSEVLAAVPAAYEYYVRGRGYLQEYQKAENIDGAIKEFEQALKISPNYAPAYAGLGEAHWRGYEANRGKSWLDLAAANCQKALSFGPHLAEAHTCMGDVYTDTGHYGDAVDEYTRALATDKSIAQTYNGLGKAYTKLGKTSEAEATYKQAIASWPQYWAVYNWLGQFYFGQARYADAAQMFRKVTELRPDNQRGYYNLGAVLTLEGKYGEAIEALNRSVAIRPTMPAYSNLGAAYFWQHKYTEAIQAFERARALDQNDYQNWGNLADALYWSLNRRPEAIAAYKEAISLAQAQARVNPNDATVRAFMAQYSAMLGDKPSAIEQIRQALALAPKDGEVLFRATLVFNQLGDRQRTLESLKKAADANYSRTVIRDTPDFGHLQSDPEFRSLIGGE